MYHVYTPSSNHPCDHEVWCRSHLVDPWVDVHIASREFFGIQPNRPYTEDLRGPLLPSIDPIFIRTSIPLCDQSTIHVFLFFSISVSFLSLHHEQRPSISYAIPGSDKFSMVSPGGAVFHLPSRLFFSLIRISWSPPQSPCKSSTSMMDGLRCLIVYRGKGNHFCGSSSPARSVFYGKITISHSYRAAGRQT